MGGGILERALGVRDAQKSRGEKLVCKINCLTATLLVMLILLTLICHDISESRSKADSLCFLDSLSTLFAPHDSTQIM